MKSGKNVWICDYCQKVFKGEKDGARPSQCSDKECKSEQFSAKYPLNRVNKGVYHYYVGITPWDRDANAGMKSDARSQMNNW